MKTCPWRPLLLASVALTLAGCGNPATKEALQKSTALVEQKQYNDANTTLVDALRAREAKIRAENPIPTDAAGGSALTQKVQADSEILQMERAQIPIYLLMERPDLASAVYDDILTGSPGDKVIDETLANPNPLIRAGAVRVLGLAGKPEAVDALARATRDPDQDVRRAAVAALGTIKDPRTLDPLVAALKDPYWFARSEAAEALGVEHDTRAVPALLEAVSDPDRTVETSAESSLVTLCTLSGTTADEFARHLNDPNPKLVVVSAVCLGLMKDRRAVPILMALAVSPNPDTRLHAVKALGETGDPSVIPTLRQCLKDPEVNVRGWSIIGLNKLNDAGSIDTLRAIAGDPGELSTVRAAAQAAVDHITPAAATTRGKL